MKKILLFMILLLVPCFVYADELYFKENALNIAPGNKKNVDLVINTDNGFNNAKFTIITTNYDVGFRTSWSDEVVAKQENGLYSVSLKENKTGEVVIANVTINVKDDSKLGTVGTIKASKVNIDGINISSSEVKVTASNEKSNNNNLKELSSKIVSIDFDKEKLDYEVEVDSSVKELDLVATSEDEKAKVVISNQKLNKNKTIITIKVTSEKGDLKAYKVVVNKKKEVKTTTKYSGSKNIEETKVDKKGFLVVLVCLLIVILLDIVYINKKRKSSAEWVVTYTKSIGSASFMVSFVTEVYFPSLPDAST